MEHVFLGAHKTMRLDQFCVANLELLAFSTKATPTNMFSRASCRNMKTQNNIIEKFISYSWKTASSSSKCCYVCLA